MKEIRQALDAHMTALNPKQRMAFKDKINGMSEAQRANLAIEIMKMHPQFRDTVAKLQVGGIIPVPEMPGKVHQQTITSKYEPKYEESKKADKKTVANKSGKGKTKSKESATSVGSDNIPRSNLPYVVTDQPSNVSGEGQIGEMPRQWDYTKQGVYKPLHEIGLENLYPVDEQYNVSPEVKKSTEYVDPSMLEFTTANSLGQAMGIASKYIFDNRFRVNPYFMYEEKDKILPLAQEKEQLEQQLLTSYRSKKDPGFLESPSTNRVPQFPSQEILETTRAELPRELKDMGENSISNSMVQNRIKQDLVEDPLQITQRIDESRIGQGPLPKLAGDTDLGYVTQRLSPQVFTREEISKMSTRTSDSRDSEGLEMLRANTPYGERIFVKNRQTGKWETDNWTWEQARKFAKQRNYKKGGIV